MSIRRFEEIEGWQLARELTNQVYAVASRGAFARDFGLRDQITRASGSVMHNIAEGFDGGSNAGFVKFLRYSQRSCSEVQSQLYVALDQSYISQGEFDAIYKQAAKTHAKVGGFIRYLLRTKNQEPRTKNQEPRTKNQEPRTKNQEPRTKN
ncbi:four helix bundle protein [Stieleria mannarensis]|uniref:four helix bundle protein n=1 Tax=Stieleria mannarensis TaxID=2755585 RepID=UPI0016001A71|nr:four helix bundle protein [Rhodopirellula sp. JC639]